MEALRKDNPVMEALNGFRRSQHISLSADRPYELQEGYGREVKDDGEQPQYGYED